MNGIDFMPSLFPVSSEYYDRFYPKRHTYGYNNEFVHGTGCNTNYHIDNHSWDRNYNPIEESVGPYGPQNLRYPRSLNSEQFSRQSTVLPTSRQRQERPTEHRLRHRQSPGRSCRQSESYPLFRRTDHQQNPKKREIPQEPRYERVNRNQNQRIHVRNPPESRRRSPPRDIKTERNRRIIGRCPSIKRSYYGSSIVINKRKRIEYSKSRISNSVKVFAEEVKQIQEQCSDLGVVSMDLGTDDEEEAVRKDAIEEDKISNKGMKHNRNEVEENNNAKDIHKKDNGYHTLTEETETKKDSSSISQLHDCSGKTTIDVLPFINAKKIQSKENELPKTCSQTSTNITDTEESSHSIQYGTISIKDPRLHKNDHNKEIRTGHEKGVLCHSPSRTKTVVPDIQTTNKTLVVDPRINHKAYQLSKTLPIELKIPDFLEELKKRMMRSNNPERCRQLKKGTTKIIRNRSSVCIDNVKSIRPFKESIADLRKFCCHVSIRRNECKYISPQKSQDINVSIIDTKKSYLHDKDFEKDESQVKEKVQTSSRDTKKSSNIRDQFKKPNQEGTISPVKKDLESLIDTKKSYLSNKDSDKIKSLVIERKTLNTTDETKTSYRPKQEGGKKRALPTSSVNKDVQSSVVNRRPHPPGKETEGIKSVVKQQNRPSIGNQPRSCKRKDRIEEKKQKDLSSTLIKDEPQEAKMRRKFVGIDQKESHSNPHRKDAPIPKKRPPVQGKREMVKQKQPIQRKEDPLKSSRGETVVRPFLGKRSNYYKENETPTNPKKRLKLDTNFFQHQKTHRNAKDTTEINKKSDIGKGTALKRNIVISSTTVKVRKIEIHSVESFSNENVKAASSIVIKSPLTNSSSSIVTEMPATPILPEKSNDRKYSTICSTTQVCAASDAKEITKTSFSNSKENKNTSAESSNLVNKKYSLNCPDLPESKSNSESKILQSSISMSLTNSLSSIVSKMCATSAIPEKTNDRKYSHLKHISTSACSTSQVCTVTDAKEIPKTSSNSRENKKTSAEYSNGINKEYSLNCPELPENKLKSDSEIPQQKLTRAILPMTSLPCSEGNIKASSTRAKSVDNVEYSLHIPERSESKSTSDSDMSSEELLKALEESIASMTRPRKAFQDQLPQNRDPQTTNQNASRSSTEHSSVQVDNSAAKSASSDDKVDENPMHSSEKPYEKKEATELNSEVDQASNDLQTSSGNIERAVNTSVEDNEANYDVIVREDEEFVEEDEGDEVLLRVKIIENPEVKAELEWESMINLSLDLLINQPEIKTENTESSANCSASIPTVANQVSSENDKSVRRECTPEGKPRENTIINPVIPSTDSQITLEEILKEKSSDSIPRDPVSSRKEFQTSTPKRKTTENEIINTVVPSTDSWITLEEILKEKTSASIPAAHISIRNECQRTEIETAKSKGSLTLSEQLNRSTTAEVNHNSEYPQCVYTKEAQNNSAQYANTRKCSQESCSGSSQIKRKATEVERRVCPTTITSDISTDGTRSDKSESTINYVSKSVVTTQSTSSCSNPIISTSFYNTHTNESASINETSATGSSKNIITGAGPQNSSASDSVGVSFKYPSQRYFHDNTNGHSSEVSSMDRQRRMPKMSNIVGGNILDRGRDPTGSQSEIDADFAFNAFTIVNNYILNKCRGDYLGRTLEYLKRVSNIDCGAQNVSNSMLKMRDGFAYILLANLRSLPQNMTNPISFVSFFMEFLVRTMKNDKARPFLSYYICELLSVHSKEYEKNSTLKYFKTYVENDLKVLRNISGFSMTLEEYMTLKSQIFHYLHSLTIPISNISGENCADRSTNRQNASQYVASQSTPNESYSLQNGNNNPLESMGTVSSKGSTKSTTSTSCITSSSASSYILNNSSEQEKQQTIAKDVTIGTPLGPERSTNVEGNLKRSGNTPGTTSKPPRKKRNNVKKDHSTSTLQTPSVNPAGMSPNTICCRPEQNGSSVHMMNLTCFSTCHPKTHSSIPPNTFPNQEFGAELNRNIMASGRGVPITCSRITPNNFSQQTFGRDFNRNSLPSETSASITSPRITANSYANQISGAEFNRNTMASGTGVQLPFSIIPNNFSKQTYCGDLNRNCVPSGSCPSTSSPRITANSYANQISAAEFNRNAMASGTGVPLPSSIIPNSFSKQTYCGDLYRNCIPSGSCPSTSHPRITPSSSSNQMSGVELNRNAMASGTGVPISYSSMTPNCFLKQTFARDFYGNSIPSETSASITSSRIAPNSSSNHISSAELNRMASGTGVQRSSPSIIPNSFSKQTLDSNSNRNVLPSGTHDSITSSGISPNSYHYQLYGAGLNKNIMHSETGAPITSSRITTNVFQNMVNDELNKKNVSPITGAVLTTFHRPPNTIQNQQNLPDITRNSSNILPSVTEAPITISRITQDSFHNQIYGVGMHDEIVHPAICTPPTSKVALNSNQNENHIRVAARNGKDSPLATGVPLPSSRLSPHTPQNQTNMFEATRTGTESSSPFSGITRGALSSYPTPPSSSENTVSANIGEIQMTNPSNDWNSTNEDKPNVPSPHIKHSEVKPLITSPSLQRFQVSQCSVHLKDEPDETIDLTLLEDDEVKLEPSHDGYSLTLEEPTQSLLILHNRKCLCGKDAIYLCACNTVMYCCQECQFKDWENHQRVCPAGIIP